MTIARKRQVDFNATPYYHCIGRCVRRAFLCGRDRSGRNYEHRRQWIVDRLKLLTEVFAVELVAFSVMNTHYHLVLKLAPERAADWSMTEVRDRWARLYGTPVIIELGMKPDATEAVRSRADELLEIRRQRLTDLSWFMKCLNEYIARRANLEDRCTGHFWESRFKSQALLDEKALLACMAYVDLNPIRARMADTPEGSDYTSVQARILGPEISLALFKDEVGAGEDCVPYYLRDYLQLVDWSGRAVIRGKRGAIDNELPPIIERLGFDAPGWLRAIRFFDKPVYKVIGPADALRMLAADQGRRWFRGTTDCEGLFGKI